MSPRETLYSQLPMIYRRRDAEIGEPLRALLAVLDEQLQALQVDTETLWDDLFIETAGEELVPYIGEALSLPVTRDVPAIAFSRRAYIANAIGYRRRKGTAAMLEQLARDLTNYPARVVEFFSRLAWNEAINHQTGRLVTADIRSTTALERIGGPFEEALRTTDVRRIDSGRGTHNLPNVGLFLWRTQLWPLVGANAVDMALAGQSAWRFDPLGGNRPLYAALVTETDPGAVATETAVPLALSRRRLWTQARLNPPGFTWPFTISVHGRDGGGALVVRDVAAGQIDVCDLSAIGTIPANPGAARVEVDPQLGRLVLGANLTAGLTAVEVVTSHSIPTAGTLGAGPWNRDNDAQAWLAGWTGPREGRTVDFQVVVLRDETGPGIVATLGDAITQWNAFLAGLSDVAARGRALGVILVGDSRTHAGPAPVIDMPSGAVLAVLGATWPLSPDPGGTGALVRLRGRLLADKVRPVVRGDLRVRGVATTASNRGEFLVGGLVITGQVRVEGGALQGLRLAYATVLGGGSVALAVDTAAGANASLEVTLSRSIVAGVRAEGAIDSITVTDSAVNGELNAPQTGVEATGATVLDACEVARLGATSCIFRGAVTVEQHQEGCVRFCYVAEGSRTPRRFRCQPDLAVEEAGGDAQAVTLALLKVRPRFISGAPHEPGFLLLDPAGAPEIASAAEDGGEPGCWNHMQHGIRLANLRNALPQFLRFGLESGIFFLV